MSHSKVYQPYKKYDKLPFKVVVYDKRQGGEKYTVYKTPIKSLHFLNVNGIRVCEIILGPHTNNILPCNLRIYSCRIIIKK